MLFNFFLCTLAPIHINLLKMLSGSLRKHFENLFLDLLCHASGCSKNSSTTAIPSFVELSKIEDNVDATTISTSLDILERTD